MLWECGRHWAGSSRKLVPGEGPLCLWLGNDLKIHADEKDPPKVLERGLLWEPGPGEMSVPLCCSRYTDDRL